jgi:hypothetical protein
MIPSGPLVNHVRAVQLIHEDMPGYPTACRGEEWRTGVWGIGPQERPFLSEAPQLAAGSLSAVVRRVPAHDELCNAPAMAGDVASDVLPITYPPILNHTNSYLAAGLNVVSYKGCPCRRVRRSADHED